MDVIRLATVKHMAGPGGWDGVIQREKEANEGCRRRRRKRTLSSIIVVSHASVLWDSVLSLPLITSTLIVLNKQRCVVTYKVLPEGSRFVVHQRGKKGSM